MTPEEIRAELHTDKILWMHDYAKRHGVSLNLEGECGFGRECVGILKDGIYPDYMSWDEDGNTDPNDEVIWTPPDAYYKHPCVAVLGRGVEAESQLYQWLKWFDMRGFKVEAVNVDTSRMHPIEVLMGKGVKVRMVRA